MPYLSTARRDRAAFLVGADERAGRHEPRPPRRRGGADGPGRRRPPVPGTRRSAGASSRPARRSTPGAARSPPTATSALSSSCSAFPTRRSRPSSTACSARPRRTTWLIDSLTALLDSGCRWSDAADELGVHRHTLRYRMDRLREQTGRHPDDPRAAHGAVAGGEGQAGPRRPQRKEHELTTASTDHLWRHFTAAGAPQLVIERGEGCYIWDNEGNRYLDALSALYCVNIGYGPWPEITEAAQKQLDAASVLHELGRLRDAARARARRQAHRARARSTSAASSSSAAVPRRSRRRSRSRASTTGCAASRHATSSSRAAAPTTGRPRRALDQREPGAPRPVRAPPARLPARADAVPLPLPVLLGGVQLQPAVRRRDRRHRAERGAGDRRGGHPRARPELGRLDHPAARATSSVCARSATSTGSCSWPTRSSAASAVSATGSGRPATGSSPT